MKTSREQLLEIIADALVNMALKGAKPRVSEVKPPRQYKKKKPNQNTTNYSKDSEPKD